MCCHIVLDLPCITSWETPPNNLPISGMPQVCCIHLNPSYHEKDRFLQQVCAAFHRQLCRTAVCQTPGSHGLGWIWHLSRYPTETSFRKRVRARTRLWVARLLLLDGRRDAAHHHRRLRTLHHQPRKKVLLLSAARRNVALHRPCTRQGKE